MKLDPMITIWEIKIFINNNKYINNLYNFKIINKAYKGIGDLFRAIESGIETNFREKKGHGGLASVFFLLEIAHTHFCTREDSGSNGATPRTSIKSLQDSFRTSPKFHPRIHREIIHENLKIS